MTARAYYNEHDPFAAAWLRELISYGHIAQGDVDERDIQDVLPSDLDEYTQCHFFAGIGGWSLALRLAGVSDDQPIWTGSCPCQPFSAAGKRKGIADERHLWPAFHWLIEQCAPQQVFGEQVASKDGREWLASVQANLEASYHVFGAADLCAASIGAPHIRQRLFWGATRLAHSNDERSQGRLCRRSHPKRQTQHRQLGCHCAACGLAHDQCIASQELHGFKREIVRAAEQTTSCTNNGFWQSVDWLFCQDEKWRPVESRTFPLADGVPNRVGTLRGYGNAIVPQVAAVFVEAYSEAITEYFQLTAE